MTFMEKYDADTKDLSEVLRDYIDVHFGARCPDADEQCPTCRLWKLLDEFKELTN